jgi:hypothetical protein
LSDLVAEILLRLGKVGLAGLIGALVYLVVVAISGEPGSVTIALLSFLVGAAVLQILASSPL